MPELPKSPTQPGSFWGRSYLRSNAASGTALTLLLFAVGAMASGWATGWIVLAWCALLAVPVAAAGSWASARSNYEKGMMLWFVGTMTDRHNALLQEHDQLRADHDTLRREFDNRNRPGGTLAALLAGEREVHTGTQGASTHSDIVFARQKAIDELGPRPS
jgi:hypothetical protein